MPESPFRVFILKNIIPGEHMEECSRTGDGDTPDCAAALAESTAFAEWLMRSVSIFGTAIRGPLTRRNGGFEEHFLLCLHTQWPELEGCLTIEMRLAEGEIFVADDQVCYARPDGLTRFDGEVLKAWYHDEHGMQIPDLERDVYRRSARFCRFELRSLGYNSMAARELTPKWITAVQKMQPKEWTWTWFGYSLRQIVHALEAEAEKGGDSWFVYEVLEIEDGPTLFPPLANGGLVLEVIEALMEEEGGTRQWLVKARAVFGHSQVRYAEFQSIRRLELYEVFSSSRGAFWNAGSDGMMLGEIGGEVLQELHGEVVEDVAERLRAHVIDSLSAGIEAKTGRDSSDIVDVILAELERVDVLALWFHDLAPLTDRVVESLKTSI